MAAACRFMTRESSLPPWLQDAYTVLPSAAIGPLKLPWIGGTSKDRDVGDTKTLLHGIAVAD
jgi:hypothetical protein